MVLRTISTGAAIEKEPSSMKIIDKQLKEAALNMAKAEANLEQIGLMLKEAWSEYHKAVAVHSQLKEKALQAIISRILGVK